MKRWLNDEHASNELKYETLLKLYFGGVEGAETTMHNIEVFESDIKNGLEVLKMYEKNLKKEPDNDHKCFLLTVMFGIETYEAYLRWCAKAKKMLKA